MPNYWKNNVILVRYPFTDLSGAKVRPAISVNTPHASQDLIVVPLTSHTSSLLAGEFVLADWRAAGLNVSTAVKRGVFTVRESLVIKMVGQLTYADSQQVERSLHGWLGLH